MATTDVARPARESERKRAGTEDAPEREPKAAAPAASATATPATEAPPPAPVAGPDGAPPAPSTARWRPPVAVAAVVLGMLAGIGVSIALVLVGEGTIFEGVGLLAADAVLVAIVVAFARRGAERLTPATFSIRRTPFWPALGWTLVTYFFVMAVQALWVAFVAGPEVGGGGGAGAGGSASTAVIVLVVVGVAITAPIAEEIAFRGYLFPALTRWRGPWIAALITALLFGAAHVAVYPPAFLPALAFFGFGACMLLWFTGSLLPSIGLHALNNGIVVGFAVGWSWLVPAIALGAPILAILLLLPFARERAPRAPVTT
ncbi:MAG TPA: type II CAAX endopeptidase family protein [Solirubrobacteraceae bacterium]|jgi:hypothetical protein